jgi:hypothetical protein
MLTRASAEGSISSRSTAESVRWFAPLTMTLRFFVGHRVHPVYDNRIAHASAHILDIVVATDALIVAKARYCSIVEAGLRCTDRGTDLCGGFPGESVHLPGQVRGILTLCTEIFNHFRGAAYPAPGRCADAQKRVPTPQSLHLRGGNQALRLARSAATAAPKTYFPHQDGVRTRRSASLRHKAYICEVETRPCGWRGRRRPPLPKLISRTRTVCGRAEARPYATKPTFARWKPGPAVGEVGSDRRSQNHFPHQDGLRTRRSASLRHKAYICEVGTRPCA